METLVILFILYSIFQFFFGDQKKKSRQRQQKQRPSQQAQTPAPAREGRKKEPESWQDLMKELETVFTGEPAETEEQKRARRESEFKRPEPASIQSRPTAETAGERDRRYESSSRYEHFEEDSWWEKHQAEDAPAERESALARAKRGEKISIGDEPGIDELAQDESNPIFGGATTDAEDPRKGGVSKAAASSLIQRIKNPDSAAQAIIMKEILDKPMARRRTARHTF